MILIVGGSSQGKLFYAKEHWKEEYQIINHYHEIVKNQLQNGKNPMKEAEKLLETKEKLVIISDELGCGLVPMDAFEREYREQSGRVNCYFASRADQVIRVICGIGNRIK